MLEDRAWRRRGDTGKRIRLSRIFDPHSARALVVPMDHSVTIGPLGKADHADRTAAMLASAGADAIVVSNHGGRQLDGAPSSIAALPHIAEAVGKNIEVWMDGGIRSGQDVLKARALGAQGTLIGRSFLYGLGAFGEAGVTRALQIIQKELDITMAFCGHTNIQNVDQRILLPGTYPVA